MCLQLLFTGTVTYYTAAAPHHSAVAAAPHHNLLDWNLYNRIVMCGAGDKVYNLLLRVLWFIEATSFTKAL